MAPSDSSTFELHHDAYGLCLCAKLGQLHAYSESMLSSGLRSDIVNAVSALDAATTTRAVAILILTTRLHGCRAAQSQSIDQQPKIAVLLFVKSQTQMVALLRSPSAQLAQNYKPKVSKWWWALNFSLLRFQHAWPGNSE